jgi:hypothetical protein
MDQCRKKGHLHCRNVWFSLKVQFWPWIGYRLCGSTASFDELDRELHWQYYQILPLVGVVRTTPVGSRTIDAGFFGFGLPHLGVKALIAMANKLLMHYGRKMATGRFMQMSHSLLFVQLGLSFQPLQEQYKKFGYLLTHSWMKMLWEKLSMFNMHVIVADQRKEFPREGNQCIMQVLINAGYANKVLGRLNIVRVSLQLLFMLDILTVSGNKISIEILSYRPLGEAWSNMRWPNEHHTDSDMQLWRNAMLLICPSRSSKSSIGRFIGRSHRIWCWYWSNTESTLHSVNADGKTEDVFVSGQKPNRFQYSHSQPRHNHEIICSVQPTLEGEHWRLHSMAAILMHTLAPSSFLEVLQSWGNIWLWEHMSVFGGVAWLNKSISKGTLVAVTDGSYMRELFPNLCSAVFVLECSKGCGRVFGSFSEALLVANAYRGELLGLLAIHLILLSVNKIHRTLAGSVEIVSDYLGALKRVTYLPPYQIPSQCCNSDILKTILVHCRGLTFTTYYSHVKAHEDDQASFSNLSRKVQLNCICDHTAKQRIATTASKNQRRVECFRLNQSASLYEMRKWHPRQGTISATGPTITLHEDTITIINFYHLRNLTPSTGSLSTAHFANSHSYSNYGQQSTFLIWQVRWCSSHTKMVGALYVQAATSAMKHAGTLHNALR